MPECHAPTVCPGSCRWINPIQPIGWPINWGRAFRSPARRGRGLWKMMSRCSQSRKSALKAQASCWGESMGDGLLQCWASVLFGHPNHWDPLLRIIPKADLLQTMDSNYPQGGRRNRYKRDSRREGLGGPDEWWTKPRVEWIPMGGMFPDPIESMVGFWSPENLGFSELGEALSFAAAIHQTGIPLTFKGCFGQMEGVRLGGFPDAGHVYPSEWLDWEPIQNSPLSFDNILATGGISVIGKLRVDGCNGEQLSCRNLFWRQGGGRW